MLNADMRNLAILLLLSVGLSGCIYTHTWHFQDSDNYPWPCEQKDKAGVSCFETELKLQYERHFFTGKAGFEYYCMNPLEALVQCPFVLLTELPFRRMWEKKYV